VSRNVIVYHKGFSKPDIENNAKRYCCISLGALPFWDDGNELEALARFICVASCEIMPSSQSSCRAARREGAIRRESIIVKWIVQSSQVCIAGKVLECQACDSRARPDGQSPKLGFCIGLSTYIELLLMSWNTPKCKTEANENLVRITREL
jgi:hypothetical protein